MNASSEVILMWWNSWSHQTLATQRNIKHALLYENQQFWSNPSVCSSNDLTAAIQAVYWAPSTRTTETGSDLKVAYTLRSPGL